MVDADFFDKMEAIARTIRKNRQPFGGIQLILCGDFLQLPPVTKDRSSRKYCFQVYIYIYIYIYIYTPMIGINSLVYSISALYGFCPNLINVHLVSTDLKTFILSLLGKRCPLCRAVR